jgi:hypothetical protein
MKRCYIDECQKYGYFGYSNSKVTYCLQHKKDDMKDLVNKKCEKCSKFPNFNFEGQPPKYCVEHKEELMVDVTHKKCLTHLCDTRARDKFDGYCFRCYIYTFPNSEITRNYKTKENKVVDFIQETFPKYEWIFDKRIDGGISTKRPDILLKRKKQTIIIEIDENQHKYYNCENKRLMEISQDLNFQPLVFIRFNPDEYYDDNQSKILSCFTTNKNGLLSIDETSNWNHRLEKLEENIKYWLKNRTTKTIELVELFYN